MTELDKTGLEPCPFCGGEASLRDGGPGCFFVQCDMCHATSDDRSQDTAIKAWNSRTANTSAGMTEEQVEAAAKAYATSTGYYVEFHRGLKSNSSELIRKGIRAALEASRVDAPVSQKEAVAVAAAKVKPLDLSTLLRDAFLAGRGLKDGDRLSDDDRTAWCAYDPERMNAYNRICAALYASPAPAGEPGIKALEWEEEPNEPGWWTATVEPLRLFYEARVNSRGETRAILPGEVWKPFDGNIDAAKAAAQADYEARIRSALVHPTPTLVSAPVGELDGIVAIADERRRQIAAEGWTPEHDDQHTEGVMAIAAACYALNATDNPDEPEVRFVGAELWPWADEWWKPSSPRRDLVKAGALIAAEIDRIDRASLRSPAVEGK